MHQLGFVELYFYDQFIMCLDPIVVQFCLYNKNFLIIEWRMLLFVSRGLYFCQGVEMKKFTFSVLSFYFSKLT